MYPYLLEFTRISDLAASFYLNRQLTRSHRIFDCGNTSVLFVAISAACRIVKSFWPLAALGHRVKDTRECPESGIHVRWHLRHRIQTYVEFLLERG
jgi:hypothetical protein